MVNELLQKGTTKATLNITMSKSIPFQEHTNQYEQWFEENRWVYEAELKAVKSLLPHGKYGMEIGVGTGRFAAPVGIKIGIEPSSSMRAFALKRGIKVLGAVAENLPFKDSTFTHVLMVTTICFLDDVNVAFTEAYRVLSKEGHLIIGFVDRGSLIGQEYLRHKDGNLFYRDATFYCVDEILETMKNIGFNDFDFCQTIFSDLSQITENEIVRSGYGKGSFIVIRGKK